MNSNTKNRPPVRHYLKYARKELQLTQTQFAKAVFMSLRSFRALETGERGYRDEELERIAEQLKKSPDVMKQREDDYLARCRFIARTACKG